MATLQGIQVGVVEEKISLYADDTLLFLTDVYSSLPAALQIVNDFGSYYGVKIIWDKFLIYPLHSTHSRQLCRPRWYGLTAVNIWGYVQAGQLPSSMT